MEENVLKADNKDKAEILVEALPYIQKYYGKVIVVKYGGNAMINEDLKFKVMRDIVLLSLIGVKVVLVHGGGPEISDMLKKVEPIQYLASQYFNSQDVFFIGRNMDYSLSLEASLKLKEISYIHSEAYAAGELKHGSISLIEDGTLVIALCTYRPLLEKMVSNIKEVKARGAKVIAVINHDDDETENVADHVIRLPECGTLSLPSLTIVPLQLFAYYIASLKGCDIDKPRNLAKSVTVE